MSIGSRVLRALVLIASLGLLAACESDEERAERYYQSALALMEEGDVDRALIELRNVFQYDGLHKEARQLYADTILARGDVAEAYAQYLRLIEQYPDTVEVRLTLAELAVQNGNWEEVARHGTAALELAPENPRARMIGAALDYRQATIDADEAARAAGVEVARALMAEALPDSPVGRRILIDYLANGADPAAALPVIEAALAAEPGNFGLHAVRVQILGMPGPDGTIDTDRLGAALAAMDAQFPDNRDVTQAMLNWYMGNGDLDAAEALLRRVAGPDDGPPDGHVAVVQFLATVRSPDAALAELNRLAGANADKPVADLYRTLAAAIDFENGRQAEAIAATRAVLDGAAPGDQTRQIQVSLAQMLETSGDRAGAEALVAEVLTGDPSNVAALMMRARWRILADDPDGAIADLRVADSQSPRNADILTLMAEAHERAGDRELATERLALAVEASGNAPEPALRYARQLIADGRIQPAISVLTDARRASPGNLAVLGALADLWLGQQSWTDLQGILTDLRQIDTPEATTTAQTLQAAMMLGQSRTEDSLAFLEEQIAAGQDADRALATMAVIQIRAGNTAEARALIDARLAEMPDDITFRFLSANLYAVTGEIPQAVEAFQAVIAADPGNDEPVRMLYGLLLSSGQQAEAEAVLAAGLEAIPQSTTLRWIEAGRLEQLGDFEGAIAVYEALYALDSTNLIIANNLASMIAAHRTDPADITRAVAIARRLNGVEVPAFQDTWGWLQHLDGKSAEALPALEAAAAGLPDDPQVRAHLGLVQAALGRPEAAATLTEALALAGDSVLPVFDSVRAALAAPPADAPADTPNAPPADAPDDPPATPAP